MRDPCQARCDDTTRRAASADDEIERAAVDSIRVNLISRMHRLGFVQVFERLCFTPIMSGMGAFYVFLVQYNCPQAPKFR